MPSGQLHAESPPLTLTGPMPVEALVGHIDFAVDEDWTLTVDQILGRAPPTFNPISEKSPDFGYTRNRIWMRITVQNDTPDIGEWRIYFPENFKQYFHVFAVYEDRTVVTLLALNETSTFDARPIPHPEMIAPLKLAPGEAATILISLWSEGSSYISFSFETPESLAKIYADQTAKNFVFYGMMILLITIALLSLLLLRNWIFLAYSAYAASALLYIMHVDGVAFQYLWPALPAFNSRASIFAGTGIIVFGAIYARMFLKTRGLHPVMDKALLSVIGITLVFDVSLYFTNPQLLKKTLVFLSLLAILTFTASGIVAAMTRFREVRFYLLAWIGAVISAVLLNLNHILGVNLEQSFVYDSIRATMVFDAAMMGLAIADRYTQLRQSQRTALEKSLKETKRNLNLSQRLTNLTQSYDAITQSARARDEHIQNTVHDLRQPLHSLRLKVSNLIHNTDEAHPDTEQVNATFTYLEQLIADHRVAADTERPIPADTTTNDLGIEDVMTSIADMFAQDAAAKGLDLRLAYQTVETDVDPLVIMRIVSNLVANAVNYTQSGQVDIATQPSENGPLITVSDTGPGLSQAEFAKVLERDVRLADKSGSVAGSGLGLAIANDLAQQHGIGLELGTSAGTGTKVIIRLPVINL